MARKSIPAVVVCLLLGVGTPARADRVDDLIKKLANKRNSRKVRLVTGIVLRKYLGERVETAFMKVLGDRTDDEKVRRWSALALGSLGAHKAIPLLKRLGRSSNATLKRAARKAIRRLCPTLQGRRVYADLTKVRGAGPRSRQLVATLRPFLYREVRRIRGSAVGIPGCNRPSVLDLRLSNIQGYALETKVQLRQQAGRFTVRLTVIFKDFATGQIRGTASATTAMSGSPSPSALDKVMAALVQSIGTDIRRIVRPATPKTASRKPVRPTRRIP